MKTEDLKGHLITRRANLAADHKHKREAVILMEAELIRARRESDVVFGALQATDQALSDLELPDVPKPPAKV